MGDLAWILAKGRHFAYFFHMSGLRSFLLCLVPVGLAYLCVLWAGKSTNEDALSAAIILIVVGALVSGTCVTFHLHRGMEPKGEPSGLKIFLGILAFLGTGIGYLAIGLAGCCGLAVSLD